MSQKLKGIYEALDHGNFKNALKLCSAFLQKQPTHSLCKALQAIALEQCGRRDEAIRICGEAASGTGVDDTVLNTCQVVYRRCRQGAMTVQLYEAAWSREPESEEYGVALFLASVREGDYAKSQQAATKLYKKFGKPNYLHWTVVAILLLAEGGGSPKALDLAEMMLKKAPVNMEVLKTEKEHAHLNRSQLYLMQLHLTTCRLQHKYAEALEMLEAGEGFVRLPADIAGLRLRLLAESGQPKKALASARDNVLGVAVDWAAIREYIHLAFNCPFSSDDLPQLHVELGDERIAIGDHGTRLRPKDGSAFPRVVSMEDVERYSTDDEVWNALLLLRQLQQGAAAGDAGAHVARAARLAELELRRLAFAGNAAALGPGREASWKAAVAPSDLEEFVAAIGTYLRDFGRRSACYFELKPCLLLLDRGDAAALPGLGPPEGEQPPDVAAGTARLRRAFRRPRDAAAPAELLEDARGLLARWAAAKSQGAQGPDELLALAVAALADLDRRCCPSSCPRGGGTYLLDAIAIADMGLLANPHAFQLKVLLVLLYGALGAIGPMLQVYNKMDIKNIQHDSLSFLVMDSLGSVGCHESLHGVIQNITQFHEEADKDCGDAVSMAFHSGVLHRIPEYLESLLRMSHSVLWGRAVVDEVLSDLGQSPTWEAVAECLFRQSVLVSTIASKPLDYWVLGNHDRGVLSSLHPLPLGTPLGGLATPLSCKTPWPTTPAQAARSAAASSSALIWKAGGAASSEGRDEASALEELLARPGGSPARLRLSAALLDGLCALLRREGGACEERLAAAAAAAREALGAAGGQAAAGGTGVAAALSDLASERGALSGGAGPWSSWPARFALQAAAAALGALEAAALVLRCAAGKDPWGRAEEALAHLAQAVGALAGFARGAPAVEAAEGTADAPERAFLLGAYGVPCVWALLHHCLPILIPVALWCSTAMPKAGSGKKAKEGQEALHAARTGLRGLLSALQTSLGELQDALARARGSDAGFPDTEPAGGAEALPGPLEVEDLPELARHRDQTRGLLLDAHKKHLQALRDAAGVRLALLKSRGTFKP